VTRRAGLELSCVGADALVLICVEQELIRTLGVYGLFSAPSAAQFKRELHDPANVIR